MNQSDIPKDKYLTVYLNGDYENKEYQKDYKCS